MAVSVKLSGTLLLTASDVNLFTPITDAGVYVLKIDITGASFGDEQTFVVTTKTILFAAESSTEEDERPFQAGLIGDEFIVWFPVTSPIEYLVQVRQTDAGTKRTIKFAVHEL